MRLPRNFDPIASDEQDVFTFNFAEQLKAGETISSTVWLCTLASNSALLDLTPSNRLLGIASIQGTYSQQMIGNMIAGAVYELEAQIITASAAPGYVARHLSLSAFVTCTSP